MVGGQADGEWTTVQRKRGGFKTRKKTDQKEPLESRLVCLLFVLLNWILLAFYGNSNGEKQ